MASANAMERIDCTMTCVADPGFRPTASAALAPIHPTARAAPSAAIPTCRLPLMCLSRPFPVRSSVVLTNQQREDGGQQREHQRLHQTNEQLEEIEGDLDEETDALNARHGLQHVFT